ncbi:hypothetical protein [uncultured Celeribacter sp.]|uniref:hypothetical protein n=1 Tax=uncultured Celeribacter sp. TaxID=1303376 RepID=UPI002AA70F0B|nr:hypothetical protein [uncultured Celeribacter sp.]
MSEFGAVILAGITGVAFWAFSKRGASSEHSQKVVYVEQPKPDNTAAKITAALGIVDALSGLFGKGGQSSGSTAPSTSYGSPQMSSSGLSGLLGLIGGVEAPQGYNQVYGGSKIATPKPLTQMTVGEVLDWQRQSIAAGSASSAAGRYQFLRKTLNDLVNAGYARKSDLFTPELQDRLAVALMERRGLSDYQSGRITETQFANNLAREWASLPVVTGSSAGSSYYAGDGLNKALVGVGSIINAIRGI